MCEMANGKRQKLNSSSCVTNIHSHTAWQTERLRDWMASRSSPSVPLSCLERDSIQFPCCTHYVYVTSFSLITNSQQFLFGIYVLSFILYLLSMAICGALSLGINRWQKSQLTHASPQRCSPQSRPPPWGMLIFNDASILFFILRCKRF